MSRQRTSSRHAEQHAGVGRRSAPRVPASVECVLRWDGDYVEGSLIDLSTAGAAVGVLPGMPLPPGPRVTLEIPDGDDVVAVTALVVSEDEESFASLVVRLKFEEDLPAVRQLVDDCLRTFRARQASIFRGHA